MTLSLDAWTEGDFAPLKLRGLILGGEGDLSVAQRELADQNEYGQVDLLAAMDRFHTPSARQNPMLTELFSSSDSAMVQRQVVSMLTHPDRRTSNAFPILLDAARKSDVATQGKAIAALARYPRRGEQIVPVLLSVIENGNVGIVMDSAIKTLGLFPDHAEQIVPVLGRIAKVGAKSNRTAELYALSHFRHRLDLIESVLRDALHSESEFVRKVAGQYIEEWIDGAKTP